MSRITGKSLTTHFAEVPGVVGRLEQARDERKRFRFWLGLASGLLGVLGVMALFMLIDWMWVVPAWVRALALPAVLGLAVAFFLRSRRPYSSRQAAADAEAHFPQLGQRLRTVLQYADPASETVPASPGLLGALGRETDRQSAAIDFRKLIPWPVFERRAIGLFLTSIIGLVALLASPSLRNAALRMFFLPVHYTTMSVEPGDLTLKAGEDLKLAVTLDGRPVNAANWFHRKNNGGDWIPASLALDPEPGERARPLIGLLTATLKDCQEDFEYRVAAGEVESRTYHVKIVHPRIKVAADQEPTLRFIQPDESLAVIPTTEVPIQVEARDDFGVSLLGINFKIGDGPEETLHLGRFPDQPLTAAALETLYLEKHALDYQGAITYYAFVEDNYPPRPHRVVSELRFIDILPFKQDYQFVEGEGSCNGNSTSLEELIARQRENLNRTFALERDASVDDADARQLESLARQVGALKASELSDRLARERDFAQAIARAERELGRAVERQAESRQATADANSPLAGRQRELTEDTAALADVLEQLKSAAKLDDREIAQAISQAENSSPPREIEQSMRQNADVIGSGQTEQAAQAALAAAGRLEALAHDLESARRAAAGPELERLLAAEKEAATLQERLRTVRQTSQQAGVERALGELAERVDHLSPREGSLRQAADHLATATRAGHSGGWSRDDKVQDGQASYFVPPTVYTESLAAVIAALQAKIQEMIVENSLLERNGPVPPEYKKLVEDYYRVLSQDLR